MYSIGELFVERYACESAASCTTLKNNVMFLLQLLLKVVGCCLPVLAQGLRLNWGVLLRGVCLYRLTGTTQHSAVIPAHRRVVTGPGTCSLKHFCPPQGFHGAGHMFFEAFPPTVGFSRDRMHVLWGISVRHRQRCHGTGQMCFGSYPFTTGKVVTGPGTCSLGHIRPPQAGLSRDWAQVI